MKMRVLLRRLARACVEARRPTAPFLPRTLMSQNPSRALEVARWSKNESEGYWVPPYLVALLGAGGAVASLAPLAYADSHEVGSHDPPLPSSPSSNLTPPLPSSPPGYADLEEIAKKERQRIEDALRSKGLRYGSYPRFTVAVKGQKVTIKFEIPFGCDVPQLIASVASNLGIKVNEGGGGSDMSLRAWDSAVAWQLTLSRRGNTNGGDANTAEDDLCILLFRSLLSSEKAEMEFMKCGSLSTVELDALVSVMQLVGGGVKTLDRNPGESTARVPSAKNSVASSLESMGVRIYGLDKPLVKSSPNEISWDNIAGYDEQKREIEDTILLALQSPEVYDDIARGTRCKFESNRPRAVLFEGPPGTGKTSSARVIANQAGVPLLYVPLEVVMSKYYGESERLLGKVFSLANELPDGAIIFLDEVDSFAVARDNEMHEATRRMLSVLLRQIDGFEQDKKVVVIAATNRKQDLDPALISRFDSMIVFGLPDQKTRQEIAGQYAKHLTKSELEELARITEGMSGRDIRDVCQQAERSWASKIIRGQAAKGGGGGGGLPPVVEYGESAMNRLKALSTTEGQTTIHGPDVGGRKRRGYDFVGELVKGGGEIK